MSDTNRPHTVTVEGVTRLELAGVIEKLERVKKFVNTPDIQKYLDERKKYLQYLLNKLDADIQADLQANFPGTTLTRIAKEDK